MIGKWTDLPNAPDGFRSKPSANHIDRDSHDGHEIASPDKFTREEMPMKTTTKWWFNFLIVSIGTVAVNFASLAAAVGSGLSHMYDHPTGSQSVIEALPLVLDGQFMATATLIVCYCCIILNNFNRCCLNGDYIKACI